MIPDTYIETVLDILPDSKKPLWCRLNGKSMEPVLCHGDSLLVQPGNRNIRIGDVIVFKSFQRQCAHRTVGISSFHGKRVYLTKGDNAYCFDRPVPSGHVLGKVLKAKGANGFMDLDSFSWRFRNFFIALYSYAEGRRYGANSIFWKLMDRFLSWCHNLTKFKRFHRQDMYRRIALRTVHSKALSGEKGERINEHKETC